MGERILSRRLAQEMTDAEVTAVSGAGCYASPNTICTTWQDNRPDQSTCDGGIDCDF